MFNNLNDFALTNGPEMKYTRANHGCGIFKSDQHDGRPLLVVVGPEEKEKSEYWDFTVPGSKWQISTVFSLL